MSDTPADTLATDETPASPVTVFEAAEQIMGLLEPEAEEVEQEEAESEDESESNVEPDDEEADDESEDDTQEDEEEAESRPELYEVPGTEEKVTLEELKKGYSRQADYTRKTQTLADERREFEAVQRDVRAEREKYVSLLDTMGSRLSVGDEPDPNAFPDKADFVVAHAQWLKQKSALDRIEAEKQEVRRREEEDAQKALNEYVAREKAALLAARPEWQDQERYKKDTDQLVGYLENQYGATERDLQALSVGSHRLVDMAYKAMLYDALQKEKPKVKAKGENAPTLKPGAKPKKPPASNKSAIERKSKRLKETGNVKDAASLIEELLQ